MAFPTTRPSPRSPRHACFFLLLSSHELLTLSSPLRCFWKSLFHPPSPCPDPPPPPSNTSFPITRKYIPLLIDICSGCLSVRSMSLTSPTRHFSYFFRPSQPCRTSPSIPNTYTTLCVILQYARFCPNFKHPPLPRKFDKTVIGSTVYGCRSYLSMKN
ncbi:MAG: hypothetical protein JOS17DRAFT_45991 [Linnemannia elongata]|nr:MAG: hypothetical protein JOS17DRAFT_45991 [Linnemannia elongata]